MIHGKAGSITALTREADDFAAWTANALYAIGVQKIGADFDDMPALLRRRRLIPGEAQRPPFQFRLDLRRVAFGENRRLTNWHPLGTSGDDVPGCMECDAQFAFRQAFSISALFHPESHGHLIICYFLKPFRVSSHLP